MWVVCFAFVTAPVLADSYEVKGVRMMQSNGETPNWQRPDIDAADWYDFFTRSVELKTSGIYWFRFDLEVRFDESFQHPGKLKTVMRGAYELYFNGHLIGLNGIPAQLKQDEQPGALNRTFVIPGDMLRQGKNVVTFKLSSHYKPDNVQSMFSLNIYPNDEPDKVKGLQGILGIMALTVIAMAGLYYLFAYYAQPNERHVLFLGLFCLLTFVWGWLLQAPQYVEWSYRYELWLRWLRIGFAFGAATCFFIYQLLRFQITRIWLWFTGVVGLCALLWLIFVDVDKGVLFAISVVLCCVGMYWQYWYRTRSPSHFELAFLLILLVSLIYYHQALPQLVRNFSVYFSVLVVIHLYRLHAARLEAARIKLKTIELESMLVRKNLQPHFILNSLSSLIDWVETEPERSVDFILAMAEEFRLLSAMSDQTRVKLDTELALCDNHLAVMAFRHHGAFRLARSQDIGEFQLPPALLLTLIENAFSHNNYAKADVCFSLDIERQGTGIELVFKAPMSKSRIEKGRALGTGAGGRYIRSRLAQSYPGRWQLNESQQQDLWVTCIQFEEDDA